MTIHPCDAHSIGSSTDRRRNGAGPAPLSREGFTLLELVVVVAILAILAGLAVRGLEGVDAQAQFDATRQVMTDASDATVLTGRDADGSLLVSGFVADLGRLPKAVSDDPATQLAELWSNPRNLLPMAVRPAPGDRDVLIASGWRGDYLRLGVGASLLTDGYGRAFDLLAADAATPAADGDEVAFIRSRGADGIADADGGSAEGYDADITRKLGSADASPGPAGPAVISGRVYLYDAASGLLKDPDSANGDVTIRYYGPDPVTGGVAEQTVTVAAPFTSVSFRFNATVGPRVIRAYQGTPATAGDWSTAPIKSAPVRLMLQAGGQAKDLVLQ